VAAGGNAIRGSRVGAGPMGERERGESAPRQVRQHPQDRRHRDALAVRALDVVAAVRSLEPGAKVTITYERNGDQHSAQATLGTSEGN